MNEYNKQALKFLEDTKTSIKIELATPQKSPLWSKETEKHGLNYKVTLENSRGKYTFDFWGSIANCKKIDAINAIKRLSFQQDSMHYQAERVLIKAGISLHLVRTPEGKVKEIKKLSPTAYDVLACLSPLQEDTLEEFCASFGYDVDSITALKTFDACREQDRNLRKLFTIDELEKLSEIN